MLRYVRLQLDPKELTNYIFFVSHILEELPKIGYWISPNYRGNKHGTLDNGVFREAASIMHLELDVPSLSKDYTYYAVTRIQTIIEYFYGKWREDYRPYPATVYNREGCREHLRWEDEFQEGILCTLWINDDKSLLRIAEWADDDLVDHGIYDCSESDAWFLVLLGKYLQGKTMQDNIHIVEIIRKKSRRRPKLLLDALEAIEQHPEKFGDTLTKYVKYFIKNETDPELLFTGYVSTLSSLLWETARRAGIKLPSLPEEIMDRVMTRESIGLTS